MIHFIWSKAPLENLETIKIRIFNQGTGTGEVPSQDVALVKNLLGRGSSESHESRNGSYTEVQGRVNPLTAVVPDTAPPGTWSAVYILPGITIPNG